MTNFYAPYCTEAAVTNIEHNRNVDEIEGNRITGNHC